MLKLITVGHVGMELNNSSAELHTKSCVCRRGVGALFDKSVFYWMFENWRRHQKLLDESGFGYSAKERPENVHE